MHCLQVGAVRYKGPFARLDRSRAFRPVKRVDMAEAPYTWRSTARGVCNQVTHWLTNARSVRSGVRCLVWVAIRKGLNSK